jgi:hypothetical protein
MEPSINPVFCFPDMHNSGRPDFVYEGSGVELNYPIIRAVVLPIFIIICYKPAFVEMEDDG